MHMLRIQVRQGIGDVVPLVAFGAGLIGLYHVTTAISELVLILQCAGAISGEGRER